MDRGHEDTYSPREAERILKRSGRPLSERRIRQLLQDDELEGIKDERDRWRIYQREITRLLEEYPPESSEPPESPQMDAAMLDRVFALERELGRLQGRLELEERTESTLREELERERKRTEEATARADRLEEELKEVRRPWWRRMFGD
jgi:predicted ribosome quality control (RQC) complex YloA/Tae2 family protein